MLYSYQIVTFGAEVLGCQQQKSRNTNSAWNGRSRETDKRTDRQRERQTDRQTDRDRQTETDRQRERAAVVYLAGRMYYRCQGNENSVISALHNGMKTVPWDTSK